MVATALRNDITRQTRFYSYSQIVQSLKGRQLDVYKALTVALTANELAFKMYRSGHIGDAERNKVHPRLNELVSMELVQVVGKRKCSISGRVCAIYDKAVVSGL